MLTTSDRTTWIEDAAEKRQREALTLKSPEEVKRRLFPLAGKLREDSVHQMKAGTLLYHVRTKHFPSSMPVEVLVWTQFGEAKIVSLFGSEVELFDPSALPAAQ